MRLRQKTIQEASIQLNNKKSLREIEGAARRPPWPSYNTLFLRHSLFSFLLPLLHTAPNPAPYPYDYLSVALLLRAGDVQADVERGSRTLVKSRDDDYDEDDDVEEVKL